MDELSNLVALDVAKPVWPYVFTVSALVLVGTREESGAFNFAPKHMVTPLGWDNFWGFVCTPRHSTYQNIRRESVFTVTYPRPTQVLFTSLAAGPRTDDDVKPSLELLPTFPAREVEGVFVKDGYFFLECELERISDGFGDNSLVVGRIVAAYVQEEAMRTSERDPNDLLNDQPVLAYLNGERFATIRESYPFPLPSGFKR